jgi:DNA-binding IclR family transcriptional regulator
VVREASAVPGSQAVERALCILGLFDERSERLTIGEVAQRLGVHRSTASRLMATLERHRLLELDGPGTYRLGLGLVSLAGHVLTRFPVRDGAREIVRRLRDDTEENVYLGVLDGDEVIYIDQVSSPHVRLSLDWVGRRQRLAAGVTGVVLLAYQPPDAIDELLRESRAEGDSAVPHLGHELLARVRDQGHLARYEDPVEAYAAVAVPVRDRGGAVVAALCLSVPHHRTTAEHFERELVPAAVRGAALISENLGYSPQ